MKKSAVASNVTQSALEFAHHIAWAASHGQRQHHGTTVSPILLLAVVERVAYTADCLSAEPVEAVLVVTNVGDLGPLGHIWGLRAHLGLEAQLGSLGPFGFSRPLGPWGQFGSWGPFGVSGPFWGLGAYLGSRGPLGSIWGLGAHWGSRGQFGVLGPLGAYLGS